MTAYFFFLLTDSHSAFLLMPSCMFRKQIIAYMYTLPYLFHQNFHSVLPFKAFHTTTTTTNTQLLFAQTDRFHSVQAHLPTFLIPCHLLSTFSHLILNEVLRVQKSMLHFVFSYSLLLQLVFFFLPTLLR